MNRINQLFQNKKENILSIYYTAGYPDLNDTVRIARALERAGADMLEIGFPYSDPVADGPVIQVSSKIALDNGMDLKLLFNQLKELRKCVKIPVLLMGYVNPLLQYGVENFCSACAEVGVDGLIVPDLPMVEYEEFYKDTFQQYGISNVFLITPQTAVERIHKIDSLTNGFIYMVSSSATTGTNLSLSQVTEDYFSRVAALELKNPTMIGFGISDQASFEKACQYASGAIIGTAFVKAINSDNLEEDINAFMQGFSSK